ncbi:MAG: UDP-N-acetylmuramoyl-L-alanyl-D-glutamate--2,6-diaminopimelate ligase [Bacilli bacterium]|nr:UDP-N-acetylmuramoyl-L-alanyl-D-glutamate--2,6-diaminopimelate ligase [Bacilli bacterium]
MINIKTDSKKVVPGDTFVALKGTIVDGHKYVEEAIKNGATKVIVSNNKKYSVETINVENTTKYLNEYLVNKYSKEFKNIKFIGITGTNGKTTTGFMTYQLLRKVKIKVAYIGTIGFFCNDNFEKTLNTTPDILATYNFILKAKDAGCKIVIFEASSIGLVEGRLNGIKFDATVFTNLTHDHLDYHKNMKDYLQAKLILFNNLKADGIAITNIDDKYGHFFTGPTTLTYGFGNADIKCIKHDEVFSNFVIKYDNEEYNISSPLFGKYNVSNVLASIGILIKLGVDLKTICKYYPSLSIPTGRINTINYKTNKIIIDYAHTPDGVKQVLSAAIHLSQGKTYVVFGCPGNRDRAKRPMMGKIVNKYADYFIITDDDPHYEDEQRIVDDITKNLVSDKYEVIIDRKKAISKAFSLLKENDILLILGKGHEDAIIVKDQRIPHNDLEYVSELIEKEKISIK